MNQKTVYTVGATKIYDRETTISKKRGGSVWKTLDSVKKYFKRIGGKVSLSGEEIEAAIYEVHLPNGWEEDTVDELAQGDWRPLAVTSKLGSKLYEREDQ